MKKTICLCLFAITIMVNANAAGSPKTSFEFAKPGGSLQKMWVEYNQTLHDEYGMIIHIDFSVYDMQDRDAYLVVCFQYNDASSFPVKDKNGKYTTTSGQAAVSKTFRPTYNSSVYTDYQLFMPYDELELDPGKYDLTMNVQLVYTEGGTFAWLKQYDFEYTIPDNDRGKSSKTKSTASFHPAATTGPRAVFDSLWIEHNVKQDGVSGMMMHFKFTTYDMKDMDADVAVYFSYNNAAGTQLKDKNNKYVSSSGYVAVYKDIKPAYAETTYDDLQIFMPNDEFDLDPGAYKLILDAKLIYAKGGLITYFTYYDFEYSK
jgi:hypothetical protein